MWRETGVRLAGKRKWVSKGCGEKEGKESEGEIVGGRDGGGEGQTLS